MGKKIIDTTKKKQKSNSIIDHLTSNSDVKKLYFSNCEEIDIINQPIPNLQKIKELTKTDFRDYNDQFVVKKCAVRVNDIFIKKAEKKTEDSLQEAKILCDKVSFYENSQDKDHVNVENNSKDEACLSFLKFTDVNGNVRNKFYTAKDLMLILPKENKNIPKFKQRGQMIHRIKK